MAPSPSSSPNPTPPAPIPDEDARATSSALPLPMSASVILSSLPTDAHTALARVDDMAGMKVKIRFQPIGSAPPLNRRVFQVSASNRFESVVAFLRKKLGINNNSKPDTEGGGQKDRREETVICYINNVFAPGLDENVGGLWTCFKQGDKGDEQLVVGYSMTPAFG